MRFMKELVEFLEIKEVPEEWRILYFRKCIGAKSLLWYEAVGKNSKSFEELKKNFWRSTGARRSSQRSNGDFICRIVIRVTEALRSNTCCRPVEITNI